MKFKNKNSKIKKTNVVFLIANMIFSLFAFAVMVSFESGVVSGKTCYDGEGRVVDSNILEEYISCENQGYFTNTPTTTAGTPPAAAIAPVQKIINYCNFPNGDVLPWDAGYQKCSDQGGVPSYGQNYFKSDVAKTPVVGAVGTASTFSSLFGSKTIKIGEETKKITEVLPTIKSTDTDLINSFKDLGVTDMEFNSDGTLKSFISGGKFNKVTDSVKGTFSSAPIEQASILGLELVGWQASLFKGLEYAGFVVAGIQMLGNLFGADKEQISAASQAAFAGIMAWKGIDALADPRYTLLQDIFGDGAAKWISANSGLIGAGIGIGVFLLTYKKQDTKIVQFSCIPWQAPTGGANCERCNSKDLPCSEYQCKSLGQACNIVNKGTKEEKCVWVNRQDVNPPTIEPLESALLKNYKYSPDNAISPPDRGVKILNVNSTDNCVPAFTQLRFGVKLDEPAACKIDILRKGNYSDMSTFMSDGLLRYNHTFSLSLPSPEVLKSENITIENDGNYNLFVRCQDANGNSNPATFVFKYCVQQGPDTTPPLIVTTNLLNNMPVAFNQSSVNLSLYINEPSTCKWSHDDRDYDSMENTMNCNTGVFEYNAQMLYKCSTTLTGVKDKTENSFYFRCKDKPTSPDSDRNVNAQSYIFKLLGTQPLVIDSAKPDNQTIKDSTDSVKVTLSANTSAGYDKGSATCYYSNLGTENTYIKFFNTNSFRHTQDLFLPAGDYNYFIKCTDLGGNSDYENIAFKVETDSSPPLVVRAYKEENNLKILTNENSTCAYSTFGCNYDFNEGINFTTIDKISHFTPWNLQSSLYVKCQDIYGNRPNPDKCSITVKPSKLS